MKSSNKTLCAIIAALFIGCAAAPPCPYVPSGTSAAACPVCVMRDTVIANDEGARVPDFNRDAAGDPSDWSGTALPEAMPPARLYVRCRPCDCNAAGRLEPYDEWRPLNERAYARLRTTRAPYPVAIVPGFHASPWVSRFRVRKALELLAHGWVGALLLSGGHRRGGRNEAAEMVLMAAGIGAQMGIDVSDRLLVEPCACRTSTNVRNSLRMMAALRLPRGVLVTETRITGQGNLFALDFDGLVQSDLQCPIGRMTYLRGPARISVPGFANGCHASLGVNHLPGEMLIPRREPVVYWVSPFTKLPDGVVHSAMECGAGASRIAECEPDDAAEDAACTPILGRSDQWCAEPSPTPPERSLPAAPPDDDESDPPGAMP